MSICSKKFSGEPGSNSGPGTTEDKLLNNCVLMFLQDGEGQAQDKKIREYQ